MGPESKTPKELCRLKKAVKALVRQNPDGIAFPEICRTLQKESIFLGTYRNLLAMTAAVLGLLIAEGYILCRGEGTAKLFLWTGSGGELTDLADGGHAEPQPQA